MKISTLFVIVFLSINSTLFAQGDSVAKDTSKHVVKSNSEIYYSQTISGSALSDYIDDQFPNSIPIPGTNIRFAIGGYVKADFIVDLDYMEDRSEFVTGSIALNGSDESRLGGQTTFHAKETRVNLDFHSKTKNDIPLRAYVEIDFFNSDDPYDYTPHIRIATITVGGFTIGHNWLTAMDLNAMPTTIDFDFGDALVFGRTAQIRYERAAGKQIKWAVALENPNASIDNPFNLEGQGMQYMPNLIGRINWTHKLGHLQLAVVGNQPRWSGSSYGVSSAMGGGFHFTGALKFAKFDKFTWGLSYGKGWGQDIEAFSGGQADAVLNADGSLTTVPLLDIALGIEHYWAPNIASTFSVNWVELNSPDDRTADLQELGATAHANLRWRVYKRFTVGIEYMAGRQRIVDGTKGFGQRIQLGARLNFHD